MDNDSNFLKISLILENVKFNITIINYLKEHFKILLSDNIIFSNKYDDIMDKLKFLNTETNSQLKSLVMIERIYLLNEIDKNLVDIDTVEIVNKINMIESNINVMSDENLVDIDTVETINKINMIETNTNIIGDEINKIVQDYGYFSICELLKIINNSQYEKYKLNLYYKVDILERFFQPTKIKKTYSQFKDNISVKIKNITIEQNKKLPTLSKNEKNTFDKFEIDIDNLKINLIYELNKALVEIEIEDVLYIIEGYFREDMFNQLYQIDVYEYKYKNIRKKLLDTKKTTNKNKLSVFYKQYMCQFGTRDFIILDEDAIVDIINEMYELFTAISRLSILDLLEKFTNKDIYSKRDLIILLLIDDNDIDTIVEDMFENENNDYEKSIIKYKKIFDVENVIKNKDNLKDYLNNKTDVNVNVNENNNQIIKKNPIPKVKLNKSTATRYSINSIMKNFDTTNELKNLNTILSNSKKILNANVLMDFLRNSSLKTIEYENFKNSIHWTLRKKIFARSTIDSTPKNSEEISWETKLSVMNISEKAKDKVNEKIKEVRSSKENVKAETYIESFFKIPFGKFIREDIFIKSENSYNKIKGLVDKINKHITNNVDKVFVSDSLEQLKQKTIECRLTNDIENIYYDLVDEKNKINKEKQIYMGIVEKILDEAVYGHTESKREIKRLVAQWMGGKMEGAILGFHGPPGVGKTCFAKKGIAKCLFDSEGNQRPFCIFQLGGATDGSVLEGHSYTYIGAKPGRFVEFLQETKCMNPIIYFDELDKVSETEKGKEIIDILIHLTDKSQNSTLFDKYFSGIDLDFSKCIIIFSYNDANKVNRILRDRITEIKINPLKKNEKVHITKKYTFKEIGEELNFNCVMSDELIEYIIDTYTFEAGVRKLNEKFYQIFREINLRLLENPYLNLEINKELVDEILNRHYKMKHHQIHSEPKVGLVNGLYASAVGLGGITLIQIKKILTTSSNIPLELTGQQGDVMKESMSCAKTLALNLLSDNEKEVTMEELKSKPFGLHIHCPDGATPKDGPSAGITITIGIYSVLTNKPIRNDIAMTGEVDLLGNVKAIGGLDAKINGAIKAGVKLVIFPKENEQDWDKIVKDKLLDGEIEFYMAETIDQVMAKAIINE
jgi:ATP-dependent Lon protease